MEKQLELDLGEMFKWIGYGLFWLFLGIGMGSCMLLGNSRLTIDNRPKEVQTQNTNNK